MIRRLIVAPVALVAVIGFAQRSDAHNQSIAATCQAGLSIDLTLYNAGVTNTVKATEDGSTLVDSTFGAGYTHTFPNTAKTVPHAYHVVVTAGDGTSYGLDQTLTIPACETPPTSSSPTTTKAVPPSTTSAPSTTSSSVTPATTRPSPPTSTTPAPSTTVPPVTSQVAPVTTAVTATTSPPTTSTSSAAPSTTATTSPRSSTTDGTLIHVDTSIGLPPTRLPATGYRPVDAMVIGFAAVAFGALAVFAGNRRAKS